MKRIAVGVFACLAGCSHVSPQAQIRQTIDAQAAAWSEGNLDGFMAAYWQSDDLTFIAFPRAVESTAASQPSMTRGWKAVSDRYRAKYTNATSMGALSFIGVQVHLIDPDTATATGRYELRRSGNVTSTGYFILDLVRFKNDWKIVRDRTYPD